MTINSAVRIMSIGNVVFACVTVLVLLLAGIAVNAQESEAVEVEVEKESIDVPGATLGRIGESAVVDPDEFEFAEAEIKLWLDDHLHNIKKPSRLYYEFVKSGTYEEGFADSVYLDITRINDDGTRDANLEFFTAERRQEADAHNLTSITGNPVLGIYMQGDVYEMERLTSGSWRYFQRSIKLAFANTASIEAVTFQYGDKEVSGEKISIAPYLKDRRRRQFEEFAAKSYEFILSDAVPGKLFQIRTVVPDSKDPDRPLLQEVLTLQSVES
ncbi:MAG: hypothetical protein ACR2P9_04875 [Gammaproteobacteria bacterium]